MKRHVITVAIVLALPAYSLGETPDSQDSQNQATTAQPDAHLSKKDRKRLAKEEKKDRKRERKE